MQFTTNDTTNVSDGPKKCFFNQSTRHGPPLLWGLCGRSLSGDVYVPVTADRDWYVGTRRPIVEVATSAEFGTLNSMASTVSILYTSLP